MKTLTISIALLLLAAVWTAPAAAGDKQIVIDLTAVQAQSVRAELAKDKSVVKTFLTEAQRDEIAAAFPELREQLSGDVQCTLPLGGASRVMAGPFNGLTGHLTADGTQLVLERVKPK